MLNYSMKTTDEDFINNHLFVLSPKEKSKFILLTKLLLENKIICLSNGNERYWESLPFEISYTERYFKYYPFTDGPGNIPTLLFVIYQKYSLFLEVIEYIYQTDWVDIKDENNENPSMIFTFLGISNKEKIIKFFKIIVLVNLIKETLSKMSANDIRYIDVFGTIHKIDKNAVKSLNLDYLEKSLTDNEKKNKWLYSVYDYQNIDMKYLLNSLDNEKYKEIYELFHGGFMKKRSLTCVCM